MKYKKKRRKNFITVGLTGGIGSGQSTAAKIFQSLGAYVVEADAVSREIFKPGKDGWKKAVRAFGKRILTPKGEIDRALLGRIVFRDEKLRAKLNAIAHPLIIKRERELMESAIKKGKHSVFVASAPLMFEAGTYRRYDMVIVVFAPQEERIRRIMARDGITRREALLRIKAQIPLQTKKRRADFVIDNSRSVDYTRKEVVKSYNLIKRKIQNEHKQRHSEIRS